MSSVLARLCRYICLVFIPDMQNFLTQFVAGLQRVYFHLSQVFMLNLEQAMLKFTIITVDKSLAGALPYPRDSNQILHQLADVQDVV